MKNMTFKSIIEDDCKNIFLNEKEFADIHKIDGKQMPAIIDKNELFNRQSGRPHNDGTYKKTTLLYVLAKEYDKIPVIGSKIIDGKKMMLIKDFSDEDGIFAITAEEVKMQ